MGTLNKNNILFIFFLLLTSVLFIYQPVVYKTKIRAVGNCTTQGDADCDGAVNLSDFENWRKEYTRILTTSQADFSSDGQVNLTDFEIWRRIFTGGISNSPTPTVVPSGIPYRAFTNTSYWNTPLQVTAPVDSHSAQYIADSQNISHTQNYLQLTAAPGTTQAFGEPIYWAKNTDETYTITPTMYGKTVQTKIPADAKPMTGSDGGLTVYDLSGNSVVELWQASYNAATDSWTAASTTKYFLDSNGLDGKVAGSDSTENFGHRGIPSPIRGVRVDEVKSGVIRHRLECFWWATGIQVVGHYWPMSGDEGAKGGMVPEGIVARIKPSIDLSAKGLSQPAMAIAKALQEYGCIIGDNSGSGNRLKLELNEQAWKDLGITANALSSLPWSDWEFIQGGYKP